ncbi:hypothetical protein OAK91_02580 [Planctomycetaceae bacterium]|jgi:hypothetical protein|nr:hypothetical protein [Planctomycetaceae bacterium]
MIISYAAILCLVIICVFVLPFLSKGHDQSRDHQYEPDSHNHGQPRSGGWVFALLGGFVLLGVFLLLTLTWSVSRRSSPNVSQVAQPARLVSNDAIILEPPFLTVDPGSVRKTDSPILEEDAALESDLATSAYAETPQETFQSSPVAQVNLSLFGLVCLALLVGGGFWIAQHRHKWVLIPVGIVFVLLIMSSLFLYRSAEVVNVSTAQVQRMEQDSIAQREQFLQEQEPTIREAELGSGLIPMTPEDLGSSENETSENPSITEGRIVASEDLASDQATTENHAGEANSHTQSHSIPAALAFRTDYLVIGGAISLLLLAILIGAGVWIAHQGQAWTMKKFQQAAGQFVWILPMLIAVGWVGSLYTPLLSLVPLERDTQYEAETSHFYRYQSGLEVETERQFQVATKGISPWVTNGQISYTGKALVPVHSGWRESQSEAENVARRQAMRILQKDFRSTFPDAENWEIEMSLDSLNAIKQTETETRYISLLPDQTTQMFRTHLQVELSDDVRGEIVEAWIPKLRTFRTTVLQVCMVVMMVVFFAIGGSLSMDMKTHGAYSRWIRFAALSVVLAAAAGAYLIRDSLLFYQHVV